MEYAVWKEQLRAKKEKMQFTNKKFKRAMHIYSQGTGEKAEIILCYVSSHTDPEFIPLTIEDAIVFLEHYTKALDDATERSKRIDTDDE
jgi:hypothetical protein